MGRYLLFILIITFVAIVSPLAIKKSKPKVFSVKSKQDAYKLLTEMGYNQCENPSDSETDKLNRPPCQTGFESALEAFQKAYHLPATKELDSATLKLLNTPRCGISDGPAESVDLSKLWPKNRTLLWRLDYKTVPYDKTHSRRIIQESFDDWSKYTDLTFREAIENEQADFNLTFVTGKHGDGEDIPPEKGGVVAHAWRPWTRRRGQIHFDSVEDWTHEYERKGRDVNLRLVATHEIGHALGLTHSLSKDAIMYDFYQLIQPTDLLPKDDQVRIQSLYGNKTTTVSKNCVIHSDNPQSKYEGECKDGMKHGHGILTRADGEKYEGNWVNDMKSGKGTCIWANGETYIGDWANNYLHGKGIYTWPKGDKYDGDLVNDKRSGKGTYTWADGENYIGDWVNNKRTGQGIRTYASGNKYDGNWMNDAKSGKGTYTWANGENYIGDWVNDKRTGQGIYTWLNGDKYDGDWVNDAKSGKGTYTWVSGTIYVGDWVNNKMHGKGIQTWTNGDKYDGIFKDDVPVDETMTAGGLSGDNHAKKQCLVVC